MILSDRSIKEAIVSGRLGIDPFDPRLVQPSSVDVRLDNKFLVFRNTKRAYIDVKQPAEDLMEMLEVGLDEPMFLHPHEFVLGSTIERVRMPVDLVARLEGRSSLGRLGVVIHSSLPYDEPVLFRDDAGVLDHRPIGEIVERRLSGEVVAFDRDTFEVGFHRVTNWFRELPDKIYEVRLASGRRVHVTAGHNLFTLDGAGNLVKTPTRALRPGTPVALPKWIPDPGKHGAAPEYHVLDLLSDDVKSELLCHGPTVDIALERREADTRQLLREAGLSVGHYLRGRMLPVRVLQQLEGGGELRLGPLDRLRFDGDAASLPAVVVVDGELAWLLGVYVAQGGRRAQQITIASTDQSILDRAAAALDRLGPGLRRGAGEVACGSRLASAIFEALAMGDAGPTRRLPRGALGWPRKLLDSLLAGLLQSPQQDQPRRSPGRGSDGSEPPELDCFWTTSPELVSEVLLASSRLGKPAVTQTLAPRSGCARSYVVSIARNRHSVLTGEPNPRRMPIDSPHALGESQVAAARLRGLGDTTSSNTLEVARNRRVERIETLLQIRSTDATPGPGAQDPIQKLTRLVNGLVQFDKVTEVVDTGRFETVYDLEVRSDHAHIENFLAGYGGLFVSNTAGFIDPAFEGHVTLEISNLANLPIALYPGMRIGQLSFSLMTTPAERPYGPSRGSKYTGQDLPTASRLYLDFQQQPQ